MNDITILHISDLHIDSDRLSSVFYSFLDKIKSEKENWNNIIIVVTGDLLDKCKYAYKDTVYRFFCEIRHTLGNHVKGIHIVPGNHDAVYQYNGSPIDAAFVNEFAEEKADDYFSGETIRQVFQEYVDLRNSIYDLFGRERNKNIWDVSVDEVDGRKYSFIELCSSGTSWLKGSANFNKIYISKKQRSELVDKSCHHNADLTFLLMHHPVNWVNKTEEYALQNQIMNKDGLNANFILRGHTHDQEIYHINKNYRTSMTLATGFGKPDDSEKEKAEPHMFAVYTINLDLNSMEIFNYRMRRNGTFCLDNELFSGRQDADGSDSIVFPLHAQDNRGYFDLTLADGKRTKPVYFNNEILEDFRKLHGRLLRFSIKSEALIQQLRMEVIDDIKNAGILKWKNYDKDLYELKKYYQNPHGKKSKPEILELNPVKSILNEKMDAYLQKFCISFCDEVLSDFPGVVLGRVHFRYLSRRKENTFRKICAFSTDKKRNTGVSDAVWGGLIQAAYETRKTILYSVNSDKSLKVLDQSKWTDYATAVPRLSRESGFMKKDDRERRPLLSYGVTIKCEDRRGENLMYYLDYMNMADLVRDLVGEFIRGTGICLEEFIKMMDEEGNKTNGGIQKQNRNKRIPKR